MSLGTNLAVIRKKLAFSQDDIAKRLNVSRKTVSLWEQDISVPNVYQARLLANLYSTTIEELINGNTIKYIDNIVKTTEVREMSKINWTKTWSKKYPILAKYQKEVDVEEYSKEIREMINKLKKFHGYSELDAMLVLKDILYHEWNDNLKSN